MNYIILLIGLLAVSFSPSCNNYLIHELKFSGTQVGAFRLLFASFGILCLPFLWRTRQLIWQQRKGLFKSGFLLALHFYLWNTAFEFVISIASAVIFLAAQPLIGLMLTFKDKKERVSWSMFICLIIASTGLFIVLKEDIGISPRSAIGNLFVLSASFVIIFYQLSSRKLMRKLPWVTFNFSVWFIAGFLLLSVAIVQSLFNDHSWWTPTELLEPGDFKKGLLALGTLILMSTYLGHGCYNIVVPRLKLFLINITMVSEPVLAIAIGVVLGLEEWPTGARLIGAIVTIGGLSLALIIDFVSKKEKISAS